MSKQTTTNIFDINEQPSTIINSRDRLLRLAELSSGNKNVKQQQQQQNKKPKLRIPSLSLERNNHNSQNRNKKSTTTTNNKLADLSFTNNIEHLVNSGSNSSGKINNNTAGGERVKKKHHQQQNDNQDEDDLEEEEEKFLNRWNSLHSSSSSRDSSQEYSIHPFKKITTTNQTTTTKSVLNNQHRDNDPQHQDNDGNVQQSSSTILNADINKYFHNESSNIIGSRIPLYNQGHQTSDDHDFISGFHHNVDNQCSNLYQKYYEFCRKNLLQFSSYHHNHKDNRYDQQQRRPSSLLRMQSDLQPSSLPLSSLSSNVSVKSNNIKYIPIQRINDGESTNIPSISTVKVSSKASNNQIESNFQQKSSINHHSNDKISFQQQQQQQPKFIVLDEENDYTNTPKKITTSTPKKDDFEFEHQQQPEILFPKVDLFNCDQYPPPTPSLSSDMINDKRINNGGHDDLIGQIFSLADTQKNSMLSMIMMTGDNNFQNDNNDKSSSCDKLDIIQSPSDNRLSIDKHHHRSENDLTMKNDLTRLAHLKEEQQPQQSDNYYYDGMIDRFRKKFSLRSQQRISLSADNSPKHKINNNLNYKIDINQNKIDFVNGGGGIEKQTKKQLERYTPSPEIQRRRQQQFMSINRKSLRKISKKHGRLKRSQTQPLNDDNDDVEKKNLLLDKDSEIFTKNNNKWMNGEITIDNYNDDDNYKRNIIYAEAIFDYQGNDNEELSFNAGDLIEVSDISHKQWWWGTIKAITNKSISTSTKSKSTSTTTSQPSISKTMTTTCDEIRHGWIPASYVRLKVSQEDTIEESLQNVTDHHHRSLLIDNQQQQPNDNNIVDNNNDQNDMSPSSQISTTPLTTSTTTKLMSSEQVRSNIILEIWNTEKDFVKNLKDVIDGYLKPCRDRKDMFDELRIQTIFGNIEELYEFQSKFLEQLDKCIDRKNLAASCIGHCFLTNEKGFDCYSDFCKNHPLATSELQDLYTDHKYVIFFEGCRLLQNMIDISLDGFLLTPIQKICKYPLQLAELLKYTRMEHLDYQSIAEAYKCMQRVAQLVNERKSRFESLEKLLSIQELFENWEGPLLLDTSSLLIHSGEITRIIRTTWSKELTVFIFDHLLIMARKDSRLLKKRTYLFKTRIELDYIDSVISLDDNVKDNHFNIMVKNAFKFYYHPKQKWYLFQAKSLEDKEIWLRAFEQERKRCQDDQQQCFIVTEQDKKSAKLAHQNHLKQKQKPKYFGNNIRKPTLYATKISTRKPDTVIAEIPLGPMKGFEIDRYNRAGSLPSYIYHQEKHRIHNNNNNLFINDNNNHHHHPHSNKNRQSTMNKKSNRTNWFQFGNNNHNNNGGGGDDNTTKQMLK